jgi:hypothetical protein
VVFHPLFKDVSFKAGSSFSYRKHFSQRFPFLQRKPTSLKVTFFSRTTYFLKENAFLGVTITANFNLTTCVRVRGAGWPSNWR